MFEARIAGIDFNAVYDYTWGELLEYIRAVNERKRREHQHSASIAYHQAYLISKLISDGGGTKLYEAFPYWNEEEINQFRIEELGHYMRSQAQRGR